MGAGAEVSEVVGAGLAHIGPNSSTTIGGLVLISFFARAHWTCACLLSRKNSRTSKRRCKTQQELKKRAGKGNPLYHLFVNSPPATSCRTLGVPMVFMCLQTPRGAEKQCFATMGIVAGA